MHAREDLDHLYELGENYFGMSEDLDTEAGC